MSNRLFYEKLLNIPLKLLQRRPSAANFILGKNGMCYNPAVLGYYSMRIFLFLLVVFGQLTAKDRFVSLKSSEINLRVGPGKEYPVLWVFMKCDLPVLMISEFGQWRKIKFADNTEGWVHKNMISWKNTAIVVPTYAILYRYASGTHPVAKIEKNVVVKVLKKEGKWVKIEVKKMKGWMHCKDLWGVLDE